jgi:hypothetical protein
VVDAGQLVGLGMDKPSPLPQKHSQLSDSAMGQPNSGATQDSAYISTGAAPASEWHSNGSSIAQPLSAISSPKKMLAPRIFTFGIGPYCNHYFLKRLAGTGLQGRIGFHASLLVLPSCAWSHVELAYHCMGMLSLTSNHV